MISHRLNFLFVFLLQRDFYICPEPFFGLFSFSFPDRFWYTLEHFLNKRKKKEITMKLKQ